MNLTKLQRLQVEASSNGWSAVDLVLRLGIDQGRLAFWNKIDAIIYSPYIGKRTHPLDKLALEAHRLFREDYRKLCQEIEEKTSEVNRYK